MSLFELIDRVAVVTGAASGIGQRIAVGLAEFGADVGLVDRVAGSCADTSARIGALGRSSCEVAIDVTEPGAMDHAVSEIERALGPLAAAVNAAGIANAAPAEDMPIEQWRHMIDVNLTGVFLACQAEARVMLRRGRGAIVNIASMSGSIVNRDLTQAHYNASKAAVVHLSKSLAMEWATRSVRVNAISPGYTLTPMNSRPEVADRRARFEADTPLQRMAAVDEMVGPAVFLLSDASAFCTGIDLLVDGGFVCW